MTTETLDKLYLEWSQLTKARNAREIAMAAALKSIADWRAVNLSGEYEHGLRDVIRSVTDCAAAALDAYSIG